MSQVSLSDFGLRLFADFVAAYSVDASAYRLEGRSLVWYDERLAGDFDGYCESALEVCQ